MADLLALVCGVLLLVCHFPNGTPGQVWYLIVLIPDLCTLTYFYSKFKPSFDDSVAKGQLIQIQTAFHPHNEYISGKKKY